MDSNYPPMIDDAMPLDQVTAGPSEYMRKEDVGTGIEATISHLERRELEYDEKVEHKTCIVWREQGLKPLILSGPTMTNQLRGITGAQLAGQLKGVRVGIWVDPSVQYKGQAVGGIRFRPAAGIPQAQARPGVPQGGPAHTQGGYNPEDVPF